MDLSVPFVSSTSSYHGEPIANISRTFRRTESKAPTICQSVYDGHYISSLTPPGTESTASSPSPSDSSAFSTPSTPSGKRVSRPPNAFILFRSHFLANNPILKSEEKRQQNLSRVVGEVWRLMPEDQQDIWHRRAESVAKQHKLDHPDYKFVPSPRGSRRAKDKVQTTMDPKTVAQRTQELRERHTQYQGIAPQSARRKKERKAHNVNTSAPFFHSSLTTTHPAIPTSQFLQSYPISSTSADTFTIPQTPHRVSPSLVFNDHSSPVSVSSSPLSTPEGDVTSDVFGMTYINYDTPPQESNLDPSISMPEAYNMPNWTPYSAVGFPHQIDAKVHDAVHPQLAGLHPQDEDLSLQFQAVNNPFGHHGYSFEAPFFSDPDNFTFAQQDQFDGLWETGTHYNI